ncbi:MAG: carbohydrate kinase, partial [Spirochaetes bacterium]
SNTGGEALRMFFGRDLELYDRQIESMDPTGAVIYPLVRKSEKFPFYSSDATGFIVMDDLNPARLFRGFIEGISYVERLIYEKIEEIGYRVNDNIFSMGGGAYSLPWMEIRASVMSRSISRAKVVETAFGAAVIAASGVLYKNLTEAIDNMVKIEKVVYPDDRLTVIYEENYQKFIHECRKRGYLS